MTRTGGKRGFGAPRSLPSRAPHETGPRRHPWTPRRLVASAQETCVGRGDERGGKGGRGGPRSGSWQRPPGPGPGGGGQAGLRLPPAPLSPLPPISAMSEKVRPLSSPKGAETRSSTSRRTEPGCPSRGLSRAPRPACSSRQDRSRPASGPLQVPPGQESRGVAPANEARAWAAAQAPRARRPPSCVPRQETPCVLHHVLCKPEHVGTFSQTRVSRQTRSWPVSSLFHLVQSPC